MTSSPFSAAAITLTTAGPTAGPLRAHPDNGRYFADASGQAVLLVGSHTWDNLQDTGWTDPPAPFDYERYLDFLTEHGHNFFRLWHWEQGVWPMKAYDPLYCDPMPFERTGPGKALDGKLRYDLERFDERYFQRMRQRVIAARDRGIYVSIMLFDGWSIEEKNSQYGNPWPGHYLHRDNNVSGIDGDPDNRGDGNDAHTLRNPAVTAVQERYVRKVIETVGDLDNVLYEISNESRGGSHLWQHHMIRFIKRVEADRPLRHPVGMTVEFPRGSNAVLFDSPSDWVSPNPGGTDPDDPRNEDGSKVVLDDTDHTWGIGGDRKWAWKSFLRGRNPVFMDPYTSKEIWIDELTKFDADDDRWWSLRRNLGYIRRYSQRLDLAAMVPQNPRSSTGYCLVARHAPLPVLTYQPDDGPFRVDLGGIKQPVRVEWFNPQTSKATDGGTVEGGGWRELQAPFTGDAVALLTAR